jgi:hypothetical protein
LPVTETGDASSPQAATLNELLAAVAPTAAYWLTSVDSSFSKFIPSPCLCGPRVIASSSSAELMAPFAVDLAEQLLLQFGCDVSAARICVLAYDE